MKRIAVLLLFAVVAVGCSRTILELPLSDGRTLRVEHTKRCVITQTKAHAEYTSGGAWVVDLDRSHNVSPEVSKGLQKIREGLEILAPVLLGTAGGVALGG